MIPINNSDTAWLIVSDYNQDHDISHDELREDILNPETNQWIWETHNILSLDAVGTASGSNRVGYYIMPTVDSVGTNKITSRLVGGNVHH